MAETVKGKKIIYLYRVASESATEDAATLAFTTENSRNTSKDSDSTSTKDGNVRTPGTAEVEITATSLLSVGDTMVGKLEDALENDKLMEIWEVNLEEKGTGSNKYKGRYFQGYVTEVEFSTPSDESVEVSLTFGINGTGVKGDVTVTDTQAEAAKYVFKDTARTSA